LESIAKETGFKQRASIITPQAFLDTVFFSNAQSSPSLSEYSIDLAHHSAETVSKQAIDKRFNDHTKNMLTEILQKVMAKQIRRDFSSNRESNFFSEIRIMDSSEFVVSKKVAESFPGYGGAGREAIVQVQFEYELLGGKVTELSLGSALNSDYIEGIRNIDKVPPKTLLIRDLGYFAPKVLKEVSQKDIYFISRAKAQWRFYIRQNNKLAVLSTQDIINKLKNQKEKYLDIEVVAGANALTPVRLIANLLSPEQTTKRLKSKIANRGKLGKDAQEGACLNLFVTNIEKEKCDASAIYQLYTLRWQIELIFKTWKSILKVHKIHSMNAKRLECVILVKFLWVMLNWSILKLLEEETQQRISLHKLTHSIISRSKMLTATILQNKNLFSEWLSKMCDISIRHHLKEYKKCSLKESEILSQTYFKIA